MGQGSAMCKRLHLLTQMFTSMLIYFISILVAFLLFYFVLRCWFCYCCCWSCCCFSAHEKFSAVIFLYAFRTRQTIEIHAYLINTVYFHIYIFFKAHTFIVGDRSKYFCIQFSWMFSSHPAYLTAYRIIFSFTITYTLSFQQGSVSLPLTRGYTTH